MPPQTKKKPEIKGKTCSHGHQNSLTAKVCWVCGEIFAPPPSKPEFIQKTNTEVPSAPSNLPDLNIAEQECQRYVPGRQRCDDKDPSGHYCMFYSMGCAIRLKRFTIKPPG